MSDPQQPAPSEFEIPTFDPPEAPAAPVAVTPEAAPAAPMIAPPPPAYQAPSAYGTPPVPGYYGASAGAPAYGAPAPIASPDAPYAAPGGAYAAPSTGYVAPYAAVEKASSSLGLAALLLALGAAVVGSLVSGFFAVAIGARLSSNGNLDALSYDPITFLSPARDLVLGAEITFWVATVLGIWALVQGIIAIVKRRGRGMGIAAVIIAVVGPIFFTFITWVMLAVGIGTGAGSFS